VSEQISNFRVPVTKILDIGPHSNADRLEIVQCFDFAVITQKGKYKVNDTVIYIPVDSILPHDIESKIFGPDSKIKLNKSRVRQIRIRGIASQGMIVDPELLGLKNLTEGDDLAEKLKITKYEPPISENPAAKVKKDRNRYYENPYFHQYGGLVNIKWHPDLFQEGQIVVYQEKIHGSNFRAGWLPNEPKNLWQKFLKAIGKFPAYQFCYGSNNVQRQHKDKKKTTTYYGEDIYWNMVVKYDLQNKLKPNETIYAELYGPGIQKNYTYGLPEGEHRIVVFDVKKLAEDKKSNQWLPVLGVEPHSEVDGTVEKFCEERGLPMVPVLYRGPHNKELAKQYTLGPSVLGEQAVREGIVIRDPYETVCYVGKKFFKLISEDYLADDTNTDNH
jgi:RNA ligase (TIGR02306 family)